jgi:hypothetical protein
LRDRYNPTSIKRGLTLIVTAATARARARVKRRVGVIDISISIAPKSHLRMENNTRISKFTRRF